MILWLLFQRILNTIRGRFKRKQSTNFTLDVDTLRSLEFLAEQEQRTPEEIANQILGDAFRNHQAQGENWQRWQTLTPREQEITALICLNYTSRQIATKLNHLTRNGKNPRGTHFGKVRGNRPQCYAH